LLIFSASSFTENFDAKTYEVFAHSSTKTCLQAPIVNQHQTELFKLHVYE